MSQAARNSREQKPRSESGKRLMTQWTGACFLVLVIAILSWCTWRLINWMEDANHLPISVLVMSGERFLTHDDDVRKSVLALGAAKTFVTQNVDEVQQQIIQDLPWVQKVSVRKEWPDMLRIHITEYVPYAIWNNSKAMDATGKVFELPLARLNSKSYLSLYGPAGSELTTLNGYYEMKRLLDTIDMDIRSVELSERYAWQVLLSNGIKLELGRSDRMSRLERFVTLYPVLKQQTPADRHILYIDLRYESGAAVSYVPLVKE